MQKLAEVCIKRPVFATMLVMALVVIGAASWMRLGVDRFPAVDLPTVSVRVELPGASIEETETQLAQRLEEQINTIQGINELRSICGPGTVIVIVTFNLNRQIDVAAQDVRDKVAIAVRNMPREILPPIIAKFDNDQAPVVTRTSALLPWRTTSTFSTPANTIMALDGTVITGWLTSVMMSTRAKEPGHRKPRSLGTSASTSKVRFCSCTIGDSRTTRPRYTVGSPSTVNATACPTLTPAPSRSGTGTRSHVGPPAL